MVRGGPFSCASSPAELLWPLINLSGRVFDGVSRTHTSHRTQTDTHLRHNPAKCPRALIPFFVAVANAACRYCLLQVISTYIGPYRLAQQTQVLQEGHFTPYDHVFTSSQQMHTEPVEMLTIWLVSPRNRPEKPTERCSVSVSVFSVSF